MRDADRRTLVAVSGGVDSSALLLALCAGLGPARASKTLVVAHVRHDLRPARVARGDEERARQLAARVGVSFVAVPVRVRERAGNAEANARQARYAALGKLAAEHGCVAIATAHHAGDVLETLLMRIIRGSGLRGLRAVRARVGLRDAGSIAIVRPMLVCDRAQAVAICKGAGWRWREDKTNRDQRLLRNALRTRVLPELERLAPGAALRSVALSAAAGEGLAALRGSARRLLAKGQAGAKAGEGVLGMWPRAALARAPRAVLAELIVMLARRAAGPQRAQRRDALTARAVREVVDLVRSASTDRTRVVRVGAVEVRIGAASVSVRAVR